MERQYVEYKYVWPEDADYYYVLWALTSFIGCLAISDYLCPYFFEKNSKTYLKLSNVAKYEWNGRIISSLHATLVTVLCLFSLALETTQWTNPVTTVPRIGSISLAISVGYMLADVMCMLKFQRGMELYLFTFHHILVVICFSFLILYRVGLLYGVMRLTCEMSTPFLNLRWYFKTTGGEKAEFQIAIVTLIFAASFCLGRYFLSIPYWYVFVTHFRSPPHIQIQHELPVILPFYVALPAFLDCLNIVWGIPVFGITAKALRYFGLLSPKKELLRKREMNGSVTSTLGENGISKVAPKVKDDIYLNGNIHCHAPLEVPNL